MAPIHFSDNIHSRGRDLHLQTNILSDEIKIVSRLFDGGRVLTKEEQGYDSTWPAEKLRKYTELIHSEKLVSIEILFAVSSRVRTVRHPRNLNKLGLQFLKWNLLEEAINEFKLAIQYDSYFGELYLNLGEAYLREGSYKKAMEVLGKGVQISPGFADMWLKLGIAHLKSGYHKRAIEAFLKSLNINNAYDEAHFHMALCLIEILSNGHQDGGLPNKSECLKLSTEHLKKAVSISKRFQNALVEEGINRFRKREIGRALTIFWKVSDELPKVVDLDIIDAFYLGLLYGERSKDSDIIQRYVDRLETLTREHPSYPDLHNDLGVAYVVQCHDLFNRAVYQFRRALKINPKYERAEDNLKIAEKEGKGLLILLRALLK